MVFADDDIEKARIEDQSVAAKAKREAAERKREQARLAKELDKTMKAKDERGFSAALRRAGILDGSPEWMSAWKAYRAYRS
jgi:hypothetical protein